MKYLEHESDFELIIKNGTVLVDFYATWCAPCQYLSPVLEELEKEMPEVTIVKVDIDKFDNLTRRFAVMSVPTIMIYKEGKVQNTSVGFLEKEAIKDLLN